MTTDRVLLNEPQRRALAGGLRHVERDLVLVEQLLAAAYEGVMVSVVDDLSDAAHVRLLQRIDLARAVIREAHDTFALEPERLPKSRWIAAQLGLQSVDAEECEARHLAGYGEVTPELARRLDPLARRLSDLLFEMQQIALGLRSGGGLGAR